jgi:DNA-binding transcriptional regulator YiaG
MTADEFRDALDDLDMTQNLAAEVIGVDLRVLRRWAAGERDVPGSVETMLRVMIIWEIAPQEILDMRKDAF